MRTDTSLFVWIRRALLTALAAALLLSLLPRLIVGAATIHSREQTPGSQQCVGAHTVAAGETLSEIAENAGVSLSELARANNITDTNTIRVGMELCIPQVGGLSAQSAPVTPQAAPPAGTTAAWTGKYYSGRGLSGDPVLTRQDNAIHFDWSAGSPDASVPNDSFSVSWTASINFEAGAYRFSAFADDGVRIFVDDNLLLEDWNIHPATTTVRDTELTEGSHIVRVEYFEADGNASISVWWENLQQASAADCQTQPDDRLRRFWSRSTLGCARATAKTIWASWQPFQHGHMIWRQDEDALFMYTNDGKWTRFADDWNGQAPRNNRGAAPSGTQAPVRGFGYLWEANDNVFSKLGWATDQEKGFCALVQQYEKGILLIGDPVESCFGDAHNFASATLFAVNALHALDNGAWKMSCQIQAHAKLQPFWNQVDLGCPLAAGTPLWAAWQPFQRGYMIWRQDDDAVFTFENEGGWNRFADNWDNQEFTSSRGAPPDGLHAPVRGFGYLWETEDDVFADLGWATGEEKGVCVLIQRFDRGTALIGNLVDSCFEEAVNFASESPFATKMLQALDAGAWELVCPFQPHKRLDHLWNRAELGCARSAGGTLWAAWQPFQRGHMVWRQGDDALFVFVNGGRWNRFADNWDNQEFISSRGAPPEGMQAPLRGFGYLWDNDENVYNDLGWATAEERGFCALFQEYDNGFLLVSDPVPSCLEGYHNEATEIDFALHSLRALNSGAWTLK